MQEKIKALIRGNDVCVLATVWGMEPHCSLMSYVTDDDCCEIYMVTRKNTKKYRNLKENPSVSLLIDSREVDQGNRARAKALTVTGVVQRTAEEGKKADILKRLLIHHPQLQDLANQPDAEVIMVKAKAFQLLDGVGNAYYETVE